MTTYISKNAIERCSSSPTIAHPLNPRAKRRTLSLGDETGLSRCAMHLNIVAPGDETTESHVHEFVDELVYILSGSGSVFLDDVEHEVGAGDFIAFPARGPAHWMKNTGTTDLVYLVGGDRADHDVCDYPRLEKRVYVSKVPDGRRLDFVDTKAVNSVRRP
ncbi:MAG TPA: cupin domain-containing protein [Polyangiaceae bacterium]|nr:cupin domain-containing protein [Polyangiaceae bacterium]